MEQKAKEKVVTAWERGENSFLFDGMTEKVNNVKATFYDQGICFHVSMRPCPGNRSYPMRGTISIMDPDNSSRVLTVSQKTYESCLKRSGKAVHCKESIHKKMSFEIQSGAESELDVKLAIIRKVEKLVAMFGTILLEIHKTHVDKRFLTPIDVVQYYADDFIKELKITEKTQKEYLSAISQFSAALADGTKPLADFNTQDISKVLKQNKNFMRNQSVIQRFYDYCAIKKHLPLLSSQELFSEVKKPPKTKAENEKRAEHLTVESIRPGALDESHELILLNRLLKGDINYYAPGIALLLWGGFSAQQIVEMHWDDIFFDSADPYFVCVRLIQGKSCATQNFTRPIFPDGAHVLRECYMSLINAYPKKEVLKMPLICEKSDPDQKLGKDKLCRLATQLLISTGICADIKDFCGKDVSYAILNETYANNLLRIFGEDTIEVGSYKFLLGESLQFLTTSDNYASFTSESGERRLYNEFMSRHQVETVTLDQIIEEIDEDCQHSITLSPKDNHSRQVIFGTATKFTPGGEITIHAPRGATLTIEDII